MGHVYTIPARCRFAESLAAGIVARYAQTPLDLARVTVLLPTRRACRSLREAFLRATDGKPMLLPRMLPMGDVDEDELVLGRGAFVDIGADSLSLPPAISTMSRHCLLARTIGAVADPATGETPSIDQALGMAEALAALLDQVQAEGLSFDRLEEIGLDLPEHWQRVMAVLNTITEIWPTLLQATGQMDPMARRVRLMTAQTEQWRQVPPPGPVIAAGSTGSHPSSAALMAVVAELPQGAVVLPGLDRDLDALSWDSLAPTHPQYGLKRLLQVLTTERHAVQDWHDAGMSSPREDLLRHAFRPAETTDIWPEVSIPSDALQGVYRLECHSVQEEATAIALIFRETLETEGKTAALVTPDRDLAQRVAEHMQRWGIDIDDSAGVPLAQTRVGRFMRLVAEAVISGFAPVSLLAVLRHPLSTSGRAPHHRQLADFDRYLCRGTVPLPGWDDYRQRLSELSEANTLAKERCLALGQWLDGLEAATSDFSAVLSVAEVDLPTLLQAHIACAEALAADDAQSGADAVWCGEDGEAMQGFCIEALQATADLGPVPVHNYVSVLDSLMASIAVRPRFSRQKRLHILGAMEARMQPADVMILGAMNEGMWPRTPPTDPWMSRAMRQAFGLPPLERRVGLAAHDVHMASGAPELIFTRSLKSGGAPTEPSRWLRRLDAVLSAAEGDLHIDSGPWLAWARQLDAAPARIDPPQPPAPRPPVDARPRDLYVTHVEGLRRDAYGAYAKHILHLRALDPREQEATPAVLGNIMHGILERFVLDGHRSDDPDALHVLRDMAAEALDTHAVPPTLAPFWRARIDRALAWFLKTDAPRWPALQAVLVERTGAWTFTPDSGRSFTIRAKMDRVDVDENGCATVMDYKTGTVPSQKEVAAGYAPQLPLEGAIIRYGKVKDLHTDNVGQLEYWKIDGNGEGGKRTQLKDTDVLIDGAAEGLKALIASYDNPDTPYLPRAAEGHAPTYSDYLVLERLAEWKSAGMEDEA